MAAADAAGPTPLYQHLALVDKVDRIHDRSVGNTGRIEVIERTDAATHVEVQEMRADITSLKNTLDKLIWAIVGLALTVAGSTIAIAVTLGAHGP